MTTVAFSGALAPKKKAELQEIATALQISDSGTREDLQIRIKDHLDKNQTRLEDEPAFVGLFGRVKRKRQNSEKPAPAVGRFAADDSSSDQSPSRSRRITAMDPIRESTPVNEDVNDVSSMLRNPFGLLSPSLRDEGALIPSPSKSIRDMLPSSEEVLDVVKRREEVVIQQGGEILLSLRQFLSNSRNIWSITALVELIYIINAVVPWAVYELPLSPLEKPISVSLSYPPLTTFKTSAFWMTIGHWSLASLIIPALFGILISFRPAPQRSFSSPHTPNLPFDALTASIIRLAAQVTYPYSTLNDTIQGIDVLGWEWRVISASLATAFAFAEAISGSLVPKSVVVEGEDGELTQLQIEG